MTKQELKKSLKTMKNDQVSSKIVYNKGKCPMCKVDASSFTVEGRCITCTNCGWSKCGW